MSETSLNMVRVAYDALDEKLGEDIEILKIDEISVIADYLVIANGDNPNQIRAMLEQVEQRMAEAGYVTKRIEGNKNSTWILMDYGDVIVHIFSKEDRLFYDLERIWRDGKHIAREELN
ncbi:MAG: ribosome silencing factor [Eubacterium sp.]|nr:ribosome silencing factor [Eubacterium sp.]